MRRFLLVLVFVMLMASMWIGLTLGKTEGPKANPESPVRNIIYAHVPCSIAALACFTALMVASVIYLCTSKDSYDRLALACAEVGTVFAIMLNATGSIFSRAEWGKWWTTSMRLQTSAILLLLYAVYLILRASVPGSKHRRGKIAAVFGIIAFLDVPMVFISARFIEDTMHQPNVDFTSIWQQIPFGAGIVGMLLLAAVLIWLRTDILNCRAKLEELD